MTMELSTCRSLIEMCLFAIVTSVLISFSFYEDGYCPIYVAIIYPCLRLMIRPYIFQIWTQ